MTQEEEAFIEGMEYFDTRIKGYADFIRYEQLIARRAEDGKK